MWDAGYYDDFGFQLVGYHGFATLLDPAACFIFKFSKQPRPSILRLGDIFESAGGWGAERAFHRWVEEQDWRHVLPRIWHFETPNAT